jgi:hypothetical protein
MKRVVLIEINEVPHRILEAYAKKSPFLAEFLNKSERFETLAADTIQLDPWIAWPSFHRGVNDETHRLLRLGQRTEGADAAYPPVWQMLMEGGVSVGVYGSLFSSCEKDLDRYSFFVPDVFSPHDNVNPPDLQGFQNFNLSMTRASGRNADEGVSSGGGKEVLKLAKSGRIHPSTLGRIGVQLLKEKFNRRRLSRRRNTQTELHADIFISLLKEKRPDFACFYTNNVAAAMHRFWSAAMPEGSINAGRLEDEWLEQYADEVFEALYSVERMLRRLVKGEAGDCVIVLASALGQEEIPAENHSDFLTITDIGRFMEGVVGGAGELGPFESMPTMVPDYSLRFSNSRDASLVRDRLQTFAINGYRAVETLERMHSKEIVSNGDRLSYMRHDYDESGHFKHPITFSLSDEETVHISFQIDDYDGEDSAAVGNRKISFSELGLGTVSHDEGVNCTAQHSASGSLVVHGLGRPPSGAEVPVISSLDFVPSLLDHFGLTKPGYLMGEATISLARS